MTEEEILEGNKLIAEFLGSKWINDAPEDYPNGYYYQPENIEEDVPTGLPEEWSFNSSWDWLIPCIDKIYESPWYYKWEDTSGQFEKEIFINTKFIEITWDQVVEFIRWYNTQKND